MSCPCDLPAPPDPRAIPAGLTLLPRAIGGFADFRRAMLEGIRKHPALDAWRAREDDDLGVMVLEFWAYVADVVAFYDEVSAHEAYLRTARRPESLNRLIGLLGYQPRPATAATALLALLAEGRDPVTLPTASAFRSGAFGDAAPQVFETETAAEIHPLANRWTVRAPKLTRLAAGPGLWTENYLYCRRSGLDLEADDMVLIRAPGHSPTVRVVDEIADHTAADGTAQKKVTFDDTLSIANSRKVAKISVHKPTSEIGLYVDDPISSNGKRIFLERLQPGIRPGQRILIVKGAERRWFEVLANDARDRTVRPQEIITETVQDGEGNDQTVSIVIPAVRTRVTRLKLDKRINHPSRRGGQDEWDVDADAAEITVHFNLVGAAEVQGQPVMEIWPDHPLALEPGARGLATTPPDPLSPRRYLLEDAGGVSQAVLGSIDPEAGEFRFEDTVAWDAPLVPPLTIYGNVVNARRGETVAEEVLGSGDRATAGQVFRLAKAPHAYAPDTTGATERGYRSSATVWVDGVAWTEVEDLAAAGPTDEVYKLRQAEDGSTDVVFGDGEMGRRLPSGRDNILAAYRFGAGGLAPPARSITQLAKPVKGILGVTNPLAAGGGSDAEDPDDLRENAPQIALLLGRIVSLDDVQAVSASFPGVTAARAEWRWSGARQTAVIQVDCIAEETTLIALREKIRNLSEPGLQVTVEKAEAAAVALSLAIEIDPKFREEDVLSAVRDRLMNAESGLLAAANIGIGAALFRSRIFAAVLAVPGTVAVTEMLWDGAPFGGMGRDPGRGTWFDIAAGGLILNGREENSDGE